MDKELAKLIDQVPESPAINSKYEAFGVLAQAIDGAKKADAMVYEMKRSLVEYLTKSGTPSALYKDIYGAAKKAADAHIRIAAMAKRILMKLFDPPIDPEVDKL